VIKQFTNKEAAELIGKEMICRRSFFHLGAINEENSRPENIFNEGDKVNVIYLNSASHLTGQITVSVHLKGDNDGDSHIFSRDDFYKHFSISKSFDSCLDTSLDFFSARETASLLGKMVVCKESFIMNHSNSWLASNSCDAESLGYLGMFEKPPGVGGVCVFLSIGLNDDCVGEGVSLSKRDFERYFSVLQPIELSEFPLIAMG